MINDNKHPFFFFFLISKGREGSFQTYFFIAAKEMHFCVLDVAFSSRGKRKGWLEKEKNVMNTLDCYSSFITNL